MTTEVRILTVTTVDSFPSLLLVEPDGSKTLVGVGEGCQRAFLQHSQKLSQVNRVCLTHLAYDAIGGLPGMILTSADAAKAAQVNAMTKMKIGKNDKNGNGTSSNTNGHNSRIANHNSTSALPLQGLQILGPHGLCSYVRSLRHFVRRDDFPLDIRESTYHCPPAACPEEQGQKRRQRKKENKKKRKRQEECNNNSSSGNNDTSKNSDNGKHGNDKGNSNLHELPQQQLHEFYFGVHTIPIPYQIPTPTTNTNPTTTEEPSNHSDTPHQNRQDNDSMSEVLSFVFSTPPVLGKFMPDKAKALSIPPGPLYAQLKAGKSVTFPHAITGEEVTIESSQVVMPSTPGLRIAVLYYPSLDVWNQLVIKLTDDNVGPLELAIHMTPKAVWESVACRDWRHMHHTARHVWMETNDPAVWTSQYASTTNTSSISPYISACMGAWTRSQLYAPLFRTPDFLRTKAIEGFTTKIDAANDNNNNYHNDNFRKATPMLGYIVTPLSRKGFVEFDIAAYVEERRKEGAELLKQSGAIQCASSILQELSETEHVNHNNHASKAELLFTGTGSAIPCKHRNVTGMSLRMEDGSQILLDVGEGTMGQMIRASPSTNKTDMLNLLRSIQAVWVSHPHADHHLGLLRLLTDRKASLATMRDNNGKQVDPVVVMGPPPILEFLTEYEKIDPRIQSSYIFIDCRTLQRHHPGKFLALKDLLPSSYQGVLGNQVTSVTSIPVSHCPYSYAVVLEGTSFGKVAYSGDCRPSKRFAQEAQYADLLIHEATFEDGMEAEATMKRHCTVGEAMMVAQDMQAKQLVLTHFSQRYPKIPPLATRTETHPSNGKTLANASNIPVIFAFDYMALTKSNLMAASKLTPSLRLLYPEENDTTADADMVAQEEATAAMSIPGFFAVNPYE